MGRGRMNLCVYMEYPRLVLGWTTCCNPPELYYTQVFPLTMSNRLGFLNLLFCVHNLIHDKTLHYPKLVVPSGEIARLFKDIDRSGCPGGATPVPKQSEENTHSKKASQQHNTQQQKKREIIKS